MHLPPPLLYLGSCRSQSRVQCRPRIESRTRVSSLTRIYHPNETRAGMSAKTTRYNFLLSDKDRGNSFLKWDHGDDEDGLINMSIIMLSLAGNQVTSRC